MNINTTKLKKEGILVLNDVIQEKYFNEICSGFNELDKYLNYNGFYSEKTELKDARAAYEKIIDYCPKLLDIIEKDEIKNILTEYLGDDFKIVNIYPVNSLPTKLKNPKKIDLNLEGILGFHHDQLGKQIKMVITLDDINIGQNCLEYAVGSHKVTILNRYIINFFNLFGFFKNWNKDIIHHLIKKIKKEPYMFLDTKEVLKKYEVKECYVKKRSIYFFDTNGYHRQKAAGETTNMNLCRRTIFFDILPNNSFFEKIKMKMEFKSTKEINYNKIKKYL